MSSQADSAVGDDQLNEINNMDRLICNVTGAARLHNFRRKRIFNYGYSFIDILF